MNILNDLLADFSPQLLNLVFILAILRFYFIAGIFLVLFLAKRLWYNPVGFDPVSKDRISPHDTTEVNFNKLLTGFSKPFLLNKVY